MENAQHDKCIVCGKPLGYRKIRFCNDTHRRYFWNRRPDRMEKMREWQIIYNNRKATYSPDKIQCLLCGLWYRQVGTHIWQRHKMSGREYREYFDLEVKRGILPPDLRELKAEYVKENGTIENLKTGKKYWFVKGDKRAGRYKRSHITMERLHNLHKLKNI